jgi:hypothetical protein
MTSLRRMTRLGAVMLAGVTGACSGGLGGLGTVLGGGAQGNQITGTVETVNTGSQQLTITQSNGQPITVSYDSQTRVIYQNQNYPVPALEFGDRVTANVRSTPNGYYTDSIQVDQSVSAGDGATGNVHSIQGKVGYVDARNGWFTVDAGNYGTLTVSVPANARTSDLVTFQNLRAGDFIRFHGAFLNNQRVELRRFM